MSIKRPFGKSYSFTEDEMEEFGEILLVAEEIKADDKMFRLVTDYLKKKSDKITDIQSIRDRLASDKMSSKPYEKAKEESNGR